MYPEAPVTNIFMLFAAINAKSEIVADLKGLPISSEGFCDSYCCCSELALDSGRRKSGRALLMSAS
jgi:hypothetical protein